MSPACPIVRETIDDRVARLCALLVLGPLAVALAFRSPWPALFLTADFGLRGFGRRRWSPLALLARWIATILGLAPRPTNAGPKAFAAKLGFGFSLTLTLAFAFGKATAGLLVGAPFAACALLEGAFGFCVGCHIYQLGQRLGWRSHTHDSPAALR